VLLNHSLDLAELVHKPGLSVQAAGRVDDHTVHALLNADVDGLEGDTGRVGALAVRPHHLCANAVAPGLQLVRSSGAERVRRAQHDGLAVAD
jgi:hypothetical protein